MTVHLPNTFIPGPADWEYRGSMCGLPLVEGDESITDWEEFSDVTCHNCLSMGQAMQHMQSVAHPQPVRIRVYQLAKQAGLEESRAALRVLEDLGYAVKAPASALNLQGFEHAALVAMLGDL